MELKRYYRISILAKQHDEIPARVFTETSVAHMLAKLFQQALGEGVLPWVGSPPYLVQICGTLYWSRHIHNITSNPNKLLGCLR